MKKKPEVTILDPETPHVLIAIPAHNTYEIDWYLKYPKYKIVVDDLLNLIRSELKHGHHRYDSPDNDGKTIQLHHITLEFIQKKLVELMKEYDLE